MGTKSKRLSDTQMDASPYCIHLCACWLTARLSRGVNVPYIGCRMLCLYVFKLPRESIITRMWRLSSWRTPHVVCLRVFLKVVRHQPTHVLRGAYMHAYSIIFRRQRPTPARSHAVVHGHFSNVATPFSLLRTTPISKDFEGRWRTRKRHETRKYSGWNGRPSSKENASSGRS